MSKMENNFDFVTLPLVSMVKGELCVPKASGLNWGQRPGREQNQAYLPVPAYIQRSNFFPQSGVPFIIECDDGKLFECVRAQANGKAIESKKNNSLLGVYFRHRLDVIPGYMVKIQHLINYGRTSVDVFMVNEHKYYLDFST